MSAFNNDSPLDKFSFGRFEVSVAQRSVRLDGVGTDIGDRAFDLLVALVRARGQVMSKQQLMNAVWPKRVIEENTLESHMSALRRALGADRELIRTVAGRGYQFVGDIAQMGTGTSQEGMLPAPLSPLIGREENLEVLRHLIRSNRLVTLVGTGGVGKTRLAIEVAREMSENFPDRICIAELANLSSGEYVAMRVAASLGFPPADGRILEDRVASVLSNKRILLLVDNCEHVLHAVAETIETVLRAAPSLHIVATSRESLRVPGERVYPVPALTFPETEVDDPGAILQHSAVMLLESRLSASGHVQPDTVEILRYKARLCSRLDGIPLAIELAAAHVSVLGVKEVADRLDDRFALLTRGGRTVAERHQTLRGVLDWSYDLLSALERVVFARLSVFPSSFTLKVAEAIAADEQIGPIALIDCVTGLVAKSLLTATSSGVETSFRMLETTRTYASERLVLSEERPEILRRHAQYMLDILEDAQLAFAQWDSAPTVSRIRSHHDDIRAALRWAFGDGGDANLGLRLTVSAVPYWMRIAYVAECHLNVLAALSWVDAHGVSDPTLTMKLEFAYGAVLLYGGAAEDARGRFERALALADNAGEPTFSRKILSGLWASTYLRGPFKSSLQLAERFRDLCVRQSVHEDALVSERMIGASHYCLGNLQAARSHMEHFLQLAPSRNLTAATGFLVDHEVATECTLAHTLWLQGFPEQARTAIHRATTRADKIGHALSRWYSRLMCACPLALVMDGIAELQAEVSNLCETANVHGMSMWKAHVDLWEGVVSGSRGDAVRFEKLVDPIFARFAGWHFNPCLTGLLTELCRQLVGFQRLPAAEGLVTGAIRRAEEADSHASIPELYRIRGDLALSRGGHDAFTEAQNAYRHSLEFAENHSLVAWELRTSLSIAMLWEHTDAAQAGRTLLRNARAKFAEGFETVDVRQADQFLAARA